MKNLVKDTSHANGIDIGIYTQDFENEFISKETGYIYATVEEV